MKDKIVLIGESKDFKKLLQSKFNLRRQVDNIDILSIYSIKKVPINAYIILINGLEYSKNNVTKIFDYLNRVYPDIPVIYISSGADFDFISENMYNYMFYDCIQFDTQDFDFFLRIKNCLNFVKIKRVSEILNCFINTTDTAVYKTGLYRQKALRDCFDDLDEKKYVQDGTFCILTIDDSSKTKISLNRLAEILKKNLRATDIICCESDKYCIIFTDTDTAGAKLAIERIADLMGENYPLHAGLSFIGIENYDVIVSNASDGLQSAILKNVNAVSLFDTPENDNSAKSEVSSHSYKLFQKVFESKLNKIIKPLFFRFQKDCELKIQNSEIIQYANENEIVFCIRSKTLKSELTIQYDGLTKLNLLIAHSGLDSAETTTAQIPLNKFSENILMKYLKQLFKEYEQGEKDA